MKEILLFNLWGDKLDELQTQAGSKASLTLDERAYLYDDDNFTLLKEEFSRRVQEILNVALLRKDYNSLIDSFTQRCIFLFEDYIHRLQKENPTIEDEKDAVDVWETSFYECLHDVSARIPIKKDVGGVLPDPTSEFRSHVGKFICSEISNDVCHHIEKFLEKLKNKPMPQPQKKAASKSFEDYILDKDNAEVIIATLRILIQGKKGKAVAMIIRAAMQIGLILKPSHTAVKDAFGDIGAKSNFDKYMSYKYEHSELTPIVFNLKDSIK